MKPQIITFPLPFIPASGWGWETVNNFFRLADFLIRNDFSYAIANSTDFIAHPPAPFPTREGEKTFLIWKFSRKTAKFPNQKRQV
ncbi:MAG: hypothetical protein LLG42_04675 [Chloroflexi bacterium]|nr:hypothetical protein [Chloroflexota bacterium]